MSRVRPAGQPRGPRFPRVSGDEPFEEFLDVAEAKFSPRERG